MFLFCLQGTVIFLSLTFKDVYPLTPLYFPHLSATIFLHKPFLSAEWECLVYPTGISILHPSQKFPFFPSALTCCYPFFKVRCKPFPNHHSPSTQSIHPLHFHASAKSLSIQFASTGNSHSMEVHLV